MRVFYGKGWSALCTLMFGYTVRDVDCGFKLFRREIIESLAPQIASRGATFSIEWLVRATARLPVCGVAGYPSATGSG